MNRRVRVGSRYTYDPVMFDQLHPTTAKIEALPIGAEVKVINKHGCPPANTMGMCYIEHEGEFMGMVFTNSLQPIPK